VTRITSPTHAPSYILSGAVSSAIRTEKLVKHYAPEIRAVNGIGLSIALPTGSRTT
jgi:hypothetical protein